MSGIQLGKIVGRGGYGLNDVGDGRKWMYWSHNKLIQFCIVRNESDPLAVTLRDEEGRRAPISGL